MSTTMKIMNKEIKEQQPICSLTTRVYRADMQTLNEESRSVECVIATENRILVMDWLRMQIMEEILRMDGLILPESGQIPLLDTHNRLTVQGQMGSTRDFRVEEKDGVKQLIGRDYLSRSEVTNHAWTLMKEGHLTDRSAGYRVLDALLIGPGKSAEVDGKTYTASTSFPLRIALKWELVENSLCPLGADPDAKGRSKKNKPCCNGQEKEQLIISERKTKMNFSEYLERKGLVESELDQARIGELRAEYEAEEKKQEPPLQETRAQTQPAAGIDPTEAQRIAERAVRAELQRQSTIRKEAEGLGIDEREIQNCLSDPGITIDQARAKFLAILRTRNQNAVTSAPGISIPNRDIDKRVLIDALLLRAGFESSVLKEPDGQKRAEKADYYRDLTALDLCRHALVLDGCSVPVGRDEMIRAALSTQTLPTILGAVYNKSVMRGYTSVEPTWVKWCNIGSASDFKTITRVRLTGAGDLEKIPNGSDLPLGSHIEEKEQYKLSTYGKRDRFGRQDIINDDLGVLTRVAERYGRRTQLTISRLVYAHLLANEAMDDGVALFHASHHNLNTSTALSRENVAKAIAVFRKQKDKDNQVINVVPRFLLAPVDLEDLALQICTSELIVIAGNTDKIVGNKNPLMNKLAVVSDPLLSDTTLTGYSATSWYLTASPAEADTIEVGFLNGRQTPTINVIPKSTDMYVEFEGYIDVGVKSLDWRTLQKNNA